MAETNINVSRENIAQAVENVTKLSREEIQKWRDFVNAELQKTELDEKTREKYQNYKNALEKAMQVGNAQMASLQNEVVLKPVQSTDIADSEKAASEVKSENEDPKVKADSHVKATQTETPKTEKKPTIDPLKTKEELSEYQNDVAGYLKSILINNGELNAQSIKKALEMVHDFSALKYTSTTLDGFGLDMEEKDVLKHTPQAVRAVVGSVFVSSLFANGYTMKISGQEVHVFQRNGVSDVTLGDANALSTQMTAFIKGNPGFLEVLKAGLLFQSGDLEKYHQLHSSTDGKLYEPEKHSYQSFVNHLNKQDDKTLAATAIAESNMTMEKKEFDGYLAMAGVMPAQTTDLLKTMAKNPSVVKELQVMSESRSSHSGGLFGPVALSTTFTRDERAHSLQMYDGERPAEMNERFKKNPLGTAIDMVLNDGLLRGGSRAMEGLDNTPVMIKWGIIL